MITKVWSLLFFLSVILVMTYIVLVASKWIKKNDWVKSVCDYCDDKRFVSLGGTSGRIACPKCNKKK